MGTWGRKPWDNDSAADWFGNLMDKTNLSQLVEEALHEEMEEGFNVDADQIRAAAAVLILLGHIYVWPVDDLDRLLKLAISRLEEIIARNFYEGNEEWTRQIRAEIDELTLRLNNRRGKVDDPDNLKWWCFD